MNRSMKPCHPKLLALLGAFVVWAAGGGCAGTSSRLDESQLTAVGFKVLVATNAVQKDWVETLPPGQIRPMQRNGKKYFVYPDAPRNQIYVGGPKEYDEYLRLHPEYRPVTQESGSAVYAKQSDAMRQATARDLSDPFLGVTWGDLIWVP